jgi:RNA polymerase sigma-70 factor (ECF subfamily)
LGNPLPLGTLTVEAFWSLVELFQLRLVRFVQGIVGNAEDARDIVQDVFVSAWRTAQRPAAPFTAEIDERAVQRWLFRIGYNKAIDVVRHRRVIAWESLDPFSPPASLELEASPPFDDQLAESEALRAALDRLGPQDVACLRLSVIEEFTSVEIAHILAITPEAARQRLSRATSRLRAAYFALPYASPVPTPAPSPVRQSAKRANNRSLQREGSADR